MRYFILVTNEIPEISRRDVDKGTMKRETVSLANCIRSSLFTSYGVRRDVNVVVCPLKSRDKLTRIDGNKLRYMGPDERSISILLSISASKLMSEKVVGKEISSPGITVETGDLASIIGSGEKLSVLYNNLDGSDLRTVELTEKTVFVAAMNGPLRTEEAGSLLGNESTTLTAIKSYKQIENTITLLNNEIDRRLASNPTTS